MNDLKQVSTLENITSVIKSAKNTIISSTKGLCHSYATSRLHSTGHMTEQPWGCQATSEFKNYIHHNNDHFRVWVINIWWAANATVIKSSRPKTISSYALAKRPRLVQTFDKLLVGSNFFKIWMFCQAESKVRNTKSYSINYFYVLESFPSDLFLSLSLSVMTYEEDMNVPSRYK